MAEIYPDQDDQSASKGLRIHSDDGKAPGIIAEERFIQAVFLQDAAKGCEMLFRKYYGNLCNHAIKFVYSRDIAEEIVSEVFANFWQGRIFEHITASYQAYLYKAVRYRAYNYLKFELNRTTSLDAVDFRYKVPVLKPDEVLHYHELSRKLDSIIEQLPPQCRKAFQLNRLEGKKYTEVAAEMQISVSAVERLISRALSRLRSELKEDWLLGLLLVSHLLI
jgi:RNA polymerase sigma-70 factor (family 1)